MDHPSPFGSLRIPHSALRIPHSALRTPHSAHSGGAGQERKNSLYRMGELSDRDADEVAGDLLLCGSIGALSRVAAAQQNVGP
jgi:hypothetical protein